MTEKEPVKRVEKSCPLGNSHFYGAGPCFRELCAWWNPVEKDCAVNIVAGWLRGIAKLLADISDQLPGQASPGVED
jgi:hypothetical protein